MGYYDSVKDSVKEEDSKERSSGANFDTLKENAEKTSEEEQEGDDTPIEVLEEDGLSRQKPSSRQSKNHENQQARSRSQNRQSSRETKSQERNPERKTDNREETTQNNQNQGSGGNPLTAESSNSEDVSDNLASLEEKMDTLIEQNQRMIEILESFGS